ncbi:PKD domain-containing protein [Flavobacterium sp. PL02]|uniref:PKD domain-containing protein n=1 Tax=Flavobacterium sp. PL02 TaxID=3088354 RepID=UPI002B22A013|nr:gliding motility-associated C-terminal domain-containing protein [Flavobacterium sp. PL02]MEA9412771.1 gliding motility-associated C-terminal domain-containing protein [Flavobacterium sp. PL02]
MSTFQSRMSMEQSILFKFFFRKLIFISLVIVSFTTRSYGQNCSVNAGVLNVTICATDDLILAGNTPSPITGNVLWTQISGPTVVIDSPNSPTTTVGGYTGGNTYIFRYSATCADGIATYQDKVVNVQPITIANAGNNISSCPNSNGTLTIMANAPKNPGETGFWDIVGANSAGVVINFPNLPTSTITLPQTSCGTSTLEWVIEGPEYSPGQRCRTTSQITVTNYGGVTPVTAGADQTLSNCYTTTQTTDLTGSYGGCNINGQAGVWTFVSGPNTPTIDSPNSNKTQISNLVQGIYTFRWSVTGSCASGNDLVTITVPAATQNVTTLPGGDENIYFCNNSITQVTLIAQTPLYTGETVQWTQIAGDSGAVIVSPTNSTTLVTNISSAGNPYTFRYTLTNNNTGCVFTKDYNVQYNGATRTILANNGEDMVGSCNATVFTIPLAVTGTGVNQYRIVSGPSGSPLGPFPTPLQDIGNSLTLTLTSSGDYSVEFIRSQNGSPVNCDFGFDTLTILVSGAPTPSNAGSDVSLPCGDTTAMLSGVVTDDGMHFWSQLSGPNTATIADVFAVDTQISGLIPGTYVFQYITKGGGATCGFSVASVTIYVSASALGTIDAGPDQIVCASSQVTMAGSPPQSGEIGEWIQIGGPNIVIFSSLNDPNAVATGFATVSSAYVFQWTISYLHPGPSCSASISDTVTITTNSSQAASNSDAGPDACYPSGTSTFNLGGNTPTLSESGTWTVTPTTGVVIADPNDPNTMVTVPGNGTYVFTWSIETVSGLCEPNKNSVSVTIANTPPAANAGPDQEICGNTITMAATASSGGIGTWTRISGAGNYSISDEHDPNAVFTFTYSGYYIFRWTINADVCGVAFDDVTVSIGIPPHTAVAGPDQYICSNTSVTMVGNNYDDFFESGQWTLLSGAPNQPNILNPSNPNTVINGLVAGTYIFRWTILAKNIYLCTGSFDDMTVVVAPAANAGPDQSFCDVSSIQLIGNNNSTGTWVLTSTTGNVNDVIITQSPPDSYIANATVVPGNSYVFTYMTDPVTYPDSSVCPGSSDSVNIDIFSGASVDPNAGADQILCIQDVGGITSLNGNTPPPDVSLAQWRFAFQPSGSVAVIDTPNAPNSTVSGLTVPGLYILEWVFESNSCRTLSDIVRIEMNAVPSIANAGPDDAAACQTTYKTAAVPPTVGIGTWSFANPGDDPSGGDVVIDSPNSPVTTLSNITTLGTYILTWTVTNGPFSNPSLCQPTSDTVQITFNDIPPSIANAGPDQELCDVSLATMNAVAVTSGLGTWTQVPGGPNTANIASPNNEKSLMLGLIPGTYEFLWTVTTLNLNGCISQDSVKVTIYELPSTANAGPDQTIPQFSPVNLNAVPPTVGTGVWSQVSGPTVIGFDDKTSPTTAIAGTISGTYVLQWTVTNGNCAVSIDTVTITILAVADLELTKSVTPGKGSAGDIVTFNIQVFNNNSLGGTVDATGVAVRDFLPTGYTIVPGSVNLAGQYNIGDNTILWSNLMVPNGGRLNLIFQATINSTGSYVNVAEIVASNQFDPDSTPNNHIPSEDDQDKAAIILDIVDLSLTKSVSPSVVSINDNVIFTISVTNSGPNNGSGITVLDKLPPGYTYVSDNGAGKYNNTTGIWNVGNLNNGNSISLQITAKVNVATSANYINIAEIQTARQLDPDSTPGNGLPEDDMDDAAITLKLADLELSKTVLPTSAAAGDVVDFTLTLINKGPGNATGVNIQDVIPVGYTLVPGSVSNGGLYEVASAKLEWKNLVLANGASTNLTFKATVNPTGSYLNTAQVTASDLLDPDSTPNNDDGDQSEDDEANAKIIFIGPSADLSLIKNVVAGNSSPFIGTQISFELIITNSGPNNATGVQVQDLLPSGYEFINYSSSAGLYDESTGFWNVGSIDTGVSESLILDAKVLPTGTYLNITQVTASDLPDPDSTPNNDDGNQTEDDEDSVFITPIQPYTDLSLTKSVDNPTPVIGSQVTFKVVVTNNGPQNDTGVQITDLLPDGYTYNSFTVSTGTYNPVTGLWVIGNLIDGESETLQITGTVNATGNYINIAEVTASDLPDPNSTPNNGIPTENDYGTATITAINQASDLSLTKSVNTPTPLVGSQVTFSVVVTNNGPQDNTGVQITDLLPDGYTYNGFTVSTGTYNSTTGLWTVGNLINGKSETLQITGTVNTTGNYLNIAEVTAAGLPDPNSTPNNGIPTENDYGTATTTPINQASDLSLTKSVNNPTPLVGSQVTFSVVVTNNGPQDNTGVQVTDLLPDGYVYNGFTVSTGTYNSTTGLWTVGNLINGKSETLQITGTVKATGDYINIAEVTASDLPDPNSTPNNGIPTENDYGTATTTPINQASDLSLTKSVNNPTPLVGSQVTFSVVVTNNGPQDNTGVQVTDLLPSGYTYNGFTVSTGTYNSTTGLWTVGNLINGKSETLQVTGTVNATGDYLNIAEVTAAGLPDPNSIPNNGLPTENDYATATITPTNQSSDLSLTKSVNNPTPLVGSQVTFSVVVTNNGPQDNTGVQVTDLLPSGYTYNGFTVSTGTYNPVTGLWIVGNLINGKSETLQITGTVNLTGNYINSTEVTAAGLPDPDSTPNNGDATENDYATATTIPINQAANLSLTKAVDKLSQLIGNQVVFEVIITNSGPQNVTGVEVTDLLPTGYTYSSFTATKGTYNKTNGKWNIGSLINGDSQTLQITAVVNATGNYVNVAEVTASSLPDPNSTPNNGVVTEDDYATAVVTPTSPMADLSLVKTVLGGNLSPVFDSTVTFEITVSNSGPQTATGVKVIDLLPSGYQYITYSSTVGQYLNTTGIWDIGSVSSGTSASLFVTVKVNTTGNYANTAEVYASNVLDPDSTPNNNDPNEDDISTLVLTPVSAVADLSIDKKVVNNTLTPNVGSLITFSVTVTNSGPSTATGVTIKDILPSGYDFVFYNVTSGSYNRVNGIWSPGTILSGNSHTLLINVYVKNPTGATDEYLNTAEIMTSDQLDPDSTPGNGVTTEDDYDSISVTPVIVMADLSISKIALNQDATHDVGSTVIFTVTVTNDGPADATGVLVKDLLPPGFEYTTSSPTSGLYDYITGVWNTGIVANGTTQSLDIYTKVNPPTGVANEYTNTTEIIASNLPDPDSTPNNGVVTEDDYDSLQIKVAVADLSLEKTVSNKNANVNEVVTYTIQLNNDGPSTATGVAVEDMIPIGLSHITNINNGGVFSKSIIKWVNLTVPVGGITLTYQVTVENPHGLDSFDYQNIAQVTASNQFDPDSKPNNDNGDQSEDDEDSEFINIPSTDIAINKEVDKTDVPMGSEVIFTITAENLGGLTATNVEVQDILPKGYSLTSFTVTSGAYNSSTGIWTIPSVNAGSSQTLTINVKVLDFKDYLNTASLIKMDQIDTNPSNNQDTATISPNCLKIYNEFSPNDDGQNDTFYIDCISQYPDNRLQIFNRWGNLIYNKKGYNNTWDGKADGSAKVLPEGTYFYILDLGDGSAKTSGWLYLK